MPIYLCQNCHRVFCGWAVKYKHKNKCPNCGGELQEVYSDNKKSLKVEGYHKGLKFEGLKIQNSSSFFHHINKEALFLIASSYF